MVTGGRGITVGGMEKLNMSLVRETELRSCVDLDLRNHKISEISPLSFLTNLASLGIDSRHIKDFTPLNQLSSFEKLWIYPKYKQKSRR
jgi:Leucine-rich repeat (LRR) protein